MSGYTTNHHHQPTTNTGNNGGESNNTRITYEYPSYGSAAAAAAAYQYHHLQPQQPQDQDQQQVGGTGAGAAATTEQMQPQQQYYQYQQQQHPVMEHYQHQALAYHLQHYPSAAAAAATAAAAAAAAATASTNNNSGATSSTTSAAAAPNTAAAGQQSMTEGGGAGGEYSYSSNISNTNNGNGQATAPAVTAMYHHTYEQQQQQQQHYYPGSISVPHVARSSPVGNNTNASTTSTDNGTGTGTTAQQANYYQATANTNTVNANYYQNWAGGNDATSYYATTAPAPAPAPVPAPAPTRVGTTITETSATQGYAGATSRTTNSTVAANTGQNSGGGNANYIPYLPPQPQHPNAAAYGNQSSQSNIGVSAPVVQLPPIKNRVVPKPKAKRAPKGSRRGTPSKGSTIPSASAASAYPSAVTAPVIAQEKQIVAPPASLLPQAVSHPMAPPIGPTANNTLAPLLGPAPGTTKKRAPRPKKKKGAQLGTNLNNPIPEVARAQSEINQSVTTHPPKTGTGIADNKKRGRPARIEQPEPKILHSNVDMVVQECINEAKQRQATPKDLANMTRHDSPLKDMKKDADTEDRKLRANRRWRTATNRKTEGLKEPKLFRPEDLLPMSVISSNFPSIEAQAMQQVQNLEGPTGNSGSAEYMEAQQQAANRLYQQIPKSIYQIAATLVEMDSCFCIQRMRMMECHCVARNCEPSQDEEEPLLEVKASDGFIYYPDGVHVDVKRIAWFIYQHATSNNRDRKKQIIDKMIEGDKHLERLESLSEKWQEAETRSHMSQKPSGIVSKMRPYGLPIGYSIDSPNKTKLIYVCQQAFWNFWGISEVNWRNCKERVMDGFTMPKEHAAMGKRNPRLTITPELHDAVQLFMNTIVDMHGEIPQQQQQGLMSIRDVVTGGGQGQLTTENEDSQEAANDKQRSNDTPQDQPPKPKPITILPTCMSKRNLYEAWCFQRGWDIHADERGVYPKVKDYPVRQIADVPFHASKKGAAPLDVVGLWTPHSRPLPVCGWNAWQIEWKRYFAHVRTRHPQAAPPSLDPNVATPQTDLVYIKEEEIEQEANPNRFTRIFADSMQRRQNRQNSDDEDSITVSSVSSVESEEGEEKKNDENESSEVTPTNNGELDDEETSPQPVKRGRGRPKGSISKTYRKKLKFLAKKKARKEERRLQRMMMGESTTQDDYFNDEKKAGDGSDAPSAKKIKLEKTVMMI